MKRFLIGSMLAFGAFVGSSASANAAGISCEGYKYFDRVQIVESKGTIDYGLSQARSNMLSRVMDELSKLSEATGEPWRLARLEMWPASNEGAMFALDGEVVLVRSACLTRDFKAGVARAHRHRGAANWMNQIDDLRYLDEGYLRSRLPQHEQAQQGH